MGWQFVNLLEKASGKQIHDILYDHGVTYNFDAFTDTTDDNVLAVQALGIITGTGGTTFEPELTLSRAQIAAIINRVARVLGEDTDGYTHDFADAAGHWVSPELGWPVHAGILAGVGSGNFDPDGPLKTEQAIAIAYRALQYFTA
ncbi:MAG: S-layer homology domain-containing protein [Oscillospiraceae bacterium]|jgi:hypothetical protein|nr:S-layer homology domain-containing protein [Oscillospiraceae bacterium]